MKIFSIFIFAFVVFNVLEQHSTKYLLVEVAGDAPDEPPTVQVPKAKEGQRCKGGEWPEEAALPECEEGFVCKIIPRPPGTKLPERSFCQDPRGCYDCGHSGQICCRYADGSKGCTLLEDCPTVGPIPWTGGTGFRGKKNKCAKWERKGTVAKQCRKPKHKNQPCCRNAGVENNNTGEDDNNVATKCYTVQCLLGK